MKKYIAIAELWTGEEVWLLIDAESEYKAKFIAMTDSEILEVTACKELKINEEAGISHRFIITE